MAGPIRSAPDGYTLLVVNTGNAINATLYDNLNFNFIRDIAPIAGIGTTPQVMVVNPSFPARTLSAFIAYAKANPGKINMASSGSGSLAWSPLPIWLMKCHLQKKAPRR